MDVHDLVIPIRMDPSKATAALAKAGAAGKKAGDDVESGAKKGKEGLDDLNSGAQGAMKAFARLGTAQTNFQAIGRLGTAIGGEFKRAADYCKSLATEFSDLRQLMQQVAALKGLPNTNVFTVEEAKKAAAAGLTPTRMGKTSRNSSNPYAGPDRRPGSKAERTAGRAVPAESCGVHEGPRLSCF